MSPGRGATVSLFPAAPCLLCPVLASVIPGLFEVMPSKVTPNSFVHFRIGKTNTIKMSLWARRWLNGDALSVSISRPFPSSGALTLSLLASVTFYTDTVVIDIIPSTSIVFGNHKNLNSQCAQGRSELGLSNQSKPRTRSYDFNVLTVRTNLSTSQRYANYTSEICVVWLCITYFINSACRQGMEMCASWCQFLSPLRNFGAMKMLLAP